MTAMTYFPSSNHISSVPAAHRGNMQQSNRQSGNAAAGFETAAYLKFHTLRHVSSGVSSNNTLTPARMYLEDPESSSDDQCQYYSPIMYSASLVSGGSRQRKAPEDTSPESCQGHYCSFHIGGVPASTLLPDLGRPGMQPHNVQPLQHVPEQMPNSQPHAGSVIIESTTPFKRQRLSRSSGSWGSSGSARSHTSYMIPTPGQACDPCGLAEAEAQGNSQNATSVSPQFYCMGQVPSPLQAQGSSAAVMDPTTEYHPHQAAPPRQFQAYQRQFQAYPHASLQSATQLPQPSQAAPQAAMPSPQAPHQTLPQAPVTKGAAFQAGQVVWARCSGYPWWPAMVTPSAPINLYLMCTGGTLTVSRNHCTAAPCASVLLCIQFWYFLSVSGHEGC